MVTSWLIFFFVEESIDRRAIHLSLNTHVGEQACALLSTPPLAHMLVVARSHGQPPEYTPEKRHIPLSLLLSLSNFLSPLLPLSLFSLNLVR